MFLAGIADLVYGVSVVDAGCELRIHHIVEESSADNIEPFQTKMTHFVTQGKLIVLLSNM